VTTRETVSESGAGSSDSGADRDRSAALALAAARRTERLVGVFVLVLAGLLIVATSGYAIGKLSAWPPAGSLARYWLGGNRVVELSAPRGWVVAGEPVFSQLTDGEWSQVAYVETVRPTELVKGELVKGTGGAEETVVLRWHAPELDPDACEVLAYQYRGTMAETLQVLFPPAKREAVLEKLVAAFADSGETLSTHFLPLVERGVRESLPVIEAEWMAALERNREGWQAIGESHKDEWLRRLVPLAKDPVIPIARLHLEPTFQQIGRELWDRASLWRFTWRALYDRTPLPRRDLTREEWDRFVEEEVVPVIEAHADDIALATQATILQIARNPRVRAELGESFADLADDPRVRQWLTTVLRETLVDSPAVRQVWIDVWTGDEARVAYEAIGTQIEPFVRELGGEIFGTPQRGIDPGFARVLRHQILGKDRRWLIASEAAREPRPDGETARVIRRGSGDPTYPLLPPVIPQE